MVLRYEFITFVRLANALSTRCPSEKQEELPSDTMRSATLQDGALSISFDRGLVARRS